MLEDDGSGYRRDLYVDLDESARIYVTVHRSEEGLLQPCHFCIALLEWTLMRTDHVDRRSSGHAESLVTTSTTELRCNYN